MKKNENYEDAMLECDKILRPVDSDTWYDLAIKYGYSSGNSLRNAYGRWKKDQRKKDGLNTSTSVTVIDDHHVLPEVKESWIDNLKKDILIKGIASDEAFAKYPSLNAMTLAYIINDLNEEGNNIIKTNGQIYVSKNIVLSENIIKKEWNGQRVIRFGAISDTHIGSKHQQLTHLNTIYDTFEQKDVCDVYHAGDISEGIKMRAGHEQECFLHGSDEIEDYIIQKYPKRNGISTHFITGNHDHSMIKQSGHDIGIKIGKDRSDMNYLGMANVKVMLTPNCSMEINHPLDGASYALSYSIQKFADSMSGGDKPNILLNGHHHKYMYLFYRNIHMMECGCFEWQTPWMRGKRIAAHVGGSIVTVHVNEQGEIKRFITEFIPFYEQIKNDY